MNMRMYALSAAACVGAARVQQECFTTRYESAVAFGTAAEVTEEAEKIGALRRLCRCHTPDNMADFDGAVRASLDHTAVWKLTVERITGKRS